MRGKLLPMRVGMGIMPGRKGRFFLGVVGRVRMQVVQGMMLVLFCMAFLVLARLYYQVVRLIPRRCF